MLGNRNGWIIAGILLVLEAFVLWQLASLNAISPPSTGVVAKTGNVTLNLLQHPQLIDEIQLPFNPATLLPGMTKNEDAAPLYRQAIAEFQKDRLAYEELFKNGQLRKADIKELPAVVRLIEAKDCATMQLYAGKPEEIVNYSQSPPTLEAIHGAGKSASRIALYYIKEKKNDQALPLAEAVLSLGIKLCQERLRWVEFRYGYELVAEGCFLIEKLDPARAAAAAEARAAMATYMKERGTPMWTVIGAIDSGIIGRSCGDVIYIASNAKERMWKIEAILKLGQIKYNAGEPGRGSDQRYARRWVKARSGPSTPDPFVRTAARAANDLTLDAYLMIGT